MSDLVKDGGTSLLHSAIQKLSLTGDEQAVTLQTDISGRTQKVILLIPGDGEAPGESSLAYSSIADANAVDESDLLRWAAQYSAVQFRFHAGHAIAYTQFDASLSEETRQRILERLAHVADRLEYQLAEGEDRH